MRTKKKYNCLFIFCRLSCHCSLECLRSTDKLLQFLQDCIWNRNRPAFFQCWNRLRINQSFLSTTQRTSDAWYFFKTSKCVHQCKFWNRIPDSIFDHSKFSSDVSWNLLDDSGAIAVWASEILVVCSWD